MFLKLDGTFVVQLLNFAVFFAILNVVFLSPVGKAIAKRRDYINSVTSDYDRYQAEATALRSQAESVRAVARREGEQALAKARAVTSNQTAELATQYGTQCSALIEQAQKLAGDELQTARGQQPRVVQELAHLMVEKALAETIA